MVIIKFTNCRVCREGRLVAEDLTVSQATGVIVDSASNEAEELVDLDGKIIAPGYIELQTNGMLGFHFTHFQDEDQYNRDLAKVAKHLVSRGVTSFYATIPTVSEEAYKKILPCLSPRSFAGGATLLGAHVEGPYLHPTKKGAHTSSLFKEPDEVAVADVYGGQNFATAIKLLTLAPELPGANDLVSSLVNDHNVRVSLGHSSASYDEGAVALQYGATALTHVFNAMNPLHHRDPGLAGLLASPQAPYYSLIPDGIHLHPAALTMAFRANPERCILITDSIELAGLPDGIYPGHAQIATRQVKTGNRVTMEGSDVLIGSCCGLDECVRNLVRWSGCLVAEAVGCVTENVAGLMGLDAAGKLERGRAADFVVLDDTGFVLQTWVRGSKVWDTKT